MYLEFFCKCNEPSAANITSYTNSGQKWWEVHTHTRKMKRKIIDVTGPVISGFANTDLGRKNEFQTKMGNFDAGVFFLIRHGESKQGVILTI